MGNSFAGRGRTWAGGLDGHRWVGGSIGPAVATTWSSTGVRLGSVPDEPDARRFLQQRIALLAGIITAGSTVFLAVNLWTRLDGGLSLLGLGFTAHAAGTAIVLGVWLLARRRRVLTAPAIASLDGALVIAACVAWSVMGWGLTGLNGMFTGLIACMLTCLGRAVLVPTTLFRTLWTSSLALAPVPVVALFILPNAPYVGPPLPLGVAIWCALALTMSLTASRVVYGLQEKVREAQQLGQYTLEEKIGEGGMGQVFRARHALLRRPTAIKLLSKADASPAQLRRFEQEVQLTSKLAHPNTIVIYDYGHTPDGTFYYAMEYLDGMDLAALVRRDGPQPPERVIHLLTQVCAALSEAHRAGLIHRDIKPENIVVGVRGGVPDFVKVLDFGLVKEVSQGNGAGLTAENSITGTPHYMAPEAILGREVDARSDLYAVGCVGYALLTARPVFDGDSIMQVCAAHVHSEPERPSLVRAEVPGDLEAVLLACLSKDPQARPSSAEQLADMLASCEHASLWTRERAREWWLAPPTAERASGELEQAETLAAPVQVDMRERGAA
jgi:eukaryotic-like serine/threonine-protein kinase